MYSICIQVGLLLLLTATFGYVARKAIERLEAYPSTPEILKSLCEASYLGVAWLIWGYGFLFSIKIIALNTDLHIPIDTLMRIGSLIFVFAILWILYKAKLNYENVLKRKPISAADATLIFALSKLFSVVLIVVAVLIVLEFLGIPFTALLAFGGLGGIAIGFAAKDVIANLFGGLMIHVNRPFVVGDTILSINKNFEGVVEEIGWYVTKIRTLDRRPTIIPNSIISEAIIQNNSRMYNRQIKEVIGVRYDDVDKVAKIVEEIENMLQSEEEIDKEQAILVDLIQFGEYALNIELQCFTKTTDLKEWRKVKQNILLNSYKIILANKAEMPYPISIVKLQEKG